MLTWCPSHQQAAGVRPGPGTGLRDEEASSGWPPGDGVRSLSVVRTGSGSQVESGRLQPDPEQVSSC